MVVLLALILTVGNYNLFRTGTRICRDWRERRSTSCIGMKGGNGGNGGIGTNGETENGGPAPNMDQLKLQLDIERVALLIK